MAARTRPIGVDLFAGAGGMSLGFEQAGFDIVAAVEIDPVHACVHKFNFPNCEVLPGSAIDLSGDSIRNAADIGGRDIDVVFGGAPCQGFSLIGKRTLDDPRNRLVREFVRIVCELNARAFVFENVKGLTVGRHKRFLADLIGDFERMGYTIGYAGGDRARVLNAAHFGVPQDRQRLFLTGVRKGEKPPSYPAPTVNPKGRTTIDERLPPGPSCADALSDLPNLDDFDDFKSEDEAFVGDIPLGDMSGYASEMRCRTNDAWHFGHVRHWNPCVLTSSLRTAHTEISKRRFAGTECGSVEPVSRFFKLAADGISNTLRAGTDAARGAFTSPRPIHYLHPRCISVREMARLHGFPDWFRFHATKWHGARQVGNSVPPPLARAVAARVAVALGYEPERPEAAVQLGKSDLLKLDISGAAAYWGIENPISRRDRKSGAKKRKQEEVEKERLQVAAE